MAGASTNEERFIASCEHVGEADVRQKLAGGQYSERRVVWATAWLEQIDSGKSDATRAAENSSLLRAPVSSKRFAGWSLLFFLLLAGSVAVFFLR